jgi:indolepyruvate ferredoxin oxidoreductase
MLAFRALATLKVLRGTAFDPFAYTAERRLERDLLKRYEADLETILAKLSPATLETAVGLASLPQLIRGYGHVKQESIASANAERGRLLDRLAQPSVQPIASAAE